MGLSVLVQTLYSIGSIRGGGPVDLVYIVHSQSMNLIHCGCNEANTAMAEGGPPRCIGSPPLPVLVDLIVLYAFKAVHSRSKRQVLQLRALHLPSTCQYQSFRIDGDLLHTV